MSKLEQLYKNPESWSRLRSVPFVFFAHYIWPIIGPRMPETLIKKVGPYRLRLDGRKLSHFWRWADLWEPRYRRAMMKHVQPGMRVLELGSCYGYFTLLLADRVRSSGKVLAVEPFPPYYWKLVQFQTDNAIAHLEVINVGIGDGSAPFFEFGLGDSTPYAGQQDVNPVQFGVETGVLAKAGTFFAGTIVWTMTLSELLSATDFCPDVIVMDIEGAELYVIKQLLDMAQKRNRHMRSALFFEIHPRLTGEKELGRHLKMLIEAGYVLRQIDPRHFVAIVQKAADPLSSLDAWLAWRQQ